MSDGTITLNVRRSPCLFGLIVDGHACYCHHYYGPRKCPVWRMYGEQADKWHDQGDFNKDGWQGGCRWFRKKD